MSGVGTFKNLYEAVESDGEVCDADRLENCQEDGTGNVVSCGVLAVRLGGANVEVV